MYHFLWSHLFSQGKTRRFFSVCRWWGSAWKKMFLSRSIHRVEFEEYIFRWKRVVAARGAFGNIEKRDALLAWAFQIHIAHDIRWDGRCDGIVSEDEQKTIEWAQTTTTAHAQCREYETKDKKSSTYELRTIHAEAILNLLRTHSSYHLRRHRPPPPSQADTFQITYAPSEAFVFQCRFSYGRYNARHPTTQQPNIQI